MSLVMSFDVLTIEDLVEDPNIAQVRLKKSGVSIGSTLFSIPLDQLSHGKWSLRFLNS